MPPKQLKSVPMEAAFATNLRREIRVRPLTTTPPAQPAAPISQRPHLWAGSSFWHPGGLAPCPTTVAVYNNDSTSFVSSNQSIKLAKAGAQYLMTAVASVGLFDASIAQVDYTHNLSMWGGLQSCGFYVESTINGIGRLIASTNSPQDNITTSNPPEKILQFTTFFEAWQDNEELKVHVNAGYGHPSAHPVKLWARLIRLQIVRL